MASNLKGLKAKKFFSVLSGRQERFNSAKAEFPEFTDVSKWIDFYLEVMQPIMETSILTDGSYVEAADGYATSSIVTTFVIIIGVVLFSFIAPFMESPVLQPAFDNILPALFGGLAVVYVSKNWKLSVAPLVFMITLFLLVPGLAGSVGILVTVGVIVALVASRILYKKGWV